MESLACTNGARVLFFLLLLLIANLERSNCSDIGYCPKLLGTVSAGERNCSRVECGNNFSGIDCPGDTIYVENSSLCGCCPSCVRFKSDGEVCENSTAIEPGEDPECSEKGLCVVNVRTCLPGLICNEDAKCELPELKPNEYKTDECMFRKSLRQLGLVHWEPDCNADGGFSPKQCKGSLYDGECFCVDSEGNRIFGREWRSQADNQTCACSRRVFEMREQGFIASLHCSPDGNYEPLQCDTDSGVCYCVDPQTGRLDGAVVPDSEWKSLPCFSLNITGNHTDGKYLRKCESEFAGLRQITKISKDHGLDLVHMKEVKCDFDGSFSPVQLQNTMTKCVYKNGTQITIKYYMQQRSDSTTCNCARDKYEYLSTSNRTFDYECVAGSGNYNSVYDFGSYSSCVDKDGYLYGEAQNSTFYCCLSSNDCPNKLKPFCYDAGTNPSGFKGCTQNYYFLS